MNESKTSPTPSPDPLDSLLVEWSSQFECSPDQIAMMWSCVSESLISDNCSAGDIRLIDNSQKQSHFGMFHWGFRLSLAASLLLVLGLAFSMLRESNREFHYRASSAMESLAPYAFTPDELLEKRALAAEILQLCQKSVLVRKTSSGWNIDEGPLLDDAGPSRKTAMVIRCLLLESTSPTNSPDEDWRVVEQEEVITDAEYQHLAANDQPGDVEAWVHLLPDQSLWAECHDDSGEAVCVLKPNEPRIVWEEKSNDSGIRRFVVVYQCLDIDKAQAIN